MVMKFKIGDFVNTTNLNWGEKFIGQIWDCDDNKPENIQTLDGEYVYVVRHYNRIGWKVITGDFKESELIPCLAPKK
jgi:hypothetical protein